MLIADHYPAGAAAANLAKRFGVEMSNAYTDDPANYDPQLRQILFSRTNKLLVALPQKVVSAISAVLGASAVILL